ncbi:MAG: hypothetical protein AUK44_10875 [Porphyromonadaceae bacterium CG2_30_38_12]|nr:MAG: hypothetical protein AUK44_10875 [Porphyromonadaceae bacterium CG2_30_38_12]
MSKGIKKTTNILVNFVSIIVLIVTIIPIMLQFSTIQNFASDFVAKEISRKINSKITIGELQYKFFNTVSITNVYVQDQQNDTLLFVRKAYIDLDVRKLFSGKVYVNALELNSLYGNLVQFKDNTTNFDFILRAFEKKDSIQTVSNVVYKINRLKIKNSRIHFLAKRFENQPIQRSVLNTNNLNINNLNLDLSLNIFQADTLSLNLRNLSFSEKSGFELKSFSTEMFGSKKALKIQYIDLELPNSELHVTDAQLKYDSLSDFKHFAQKIKFKLPIQQSTIHLSDLKTLVPELKNLNENVDLGGTFTGSISNLKLKNFEIKHGKSFYFNSDFEINGLPKLADAFIYTNINDLYVNKAEMQDFISKITSKPFILPIELNKLGLVHYKGNITGFLSNLVAYGSLKTNIGNISTDIQLNFENELKDLKYSGSVRTANLQLDKLLGSDKLSNLSMNIKTQGAKLFNKSWKGKVNGTIQNLEFQQYNYKNIQLDGSYDGNGFDGLVRIKDEHIDANFKGAIDLTKKLPFFDFDLTVNHIDVNALHFTDNYKNSSLSFNSKTNLIGNTLDNFNGFTSVENIAFTNKDKTVNVNEIKVVSRILDEQTNFRIEADFLKGNFYGKFKYSNIPGIVNRILKNYLPSLSSKLYAKTANSNYINFDMDVFNTQAITDVLELPLRLKENAHIQGNIQNSTNKIEITGTIPYLKINKLEFEKIDVSLDNVQNKLVLNSNASLLQPKGSFSIFVNSNAQNDSISTKLGWKAQATAITNAGEILSLAHLWSEKGKIASHLDVLPSQIIISDSIWDIRRSSVDLNADSSIVINNFKLENKFQFLHVNGQTSPQQGNDIHFKLNDINLGFIFQLLKLKSISIDGFASGEASLVTKGKQPVFLAKLHVRKAKLNKKDIGDANISSSWDRENSQILLAADFVKNKKDTVGFASGVYVPRNDSIDVTYDLHGLNIDFLQRYFDGVVDDVNGYAYGKLRMFGPTNKILFAGKAFMDKAIMRVNALHTNYYFSDTIQLTPKSIILKNIAFYDAERNKGNLDGIATHNGNFANMHYNILVKAVNILGLDTQPKDNDYFFGKAYMTGTVRITGNDSESSIVVNAVTRPKSHANIQMGGASTASDNSFIKFVNHREISADSTKKVEKARFNTKVDLQIDVTPDADMQLIVDPKAGDVIAGRGNGNLRIQFDTFSDIKLYGTYTIDNGYYLFTLQTIVRKEFKIDSGSTISWTGNPFGGKMNIRGMYPLTASLSNILDPNELSNTSRRTSMPVNCILKLTDDLMAPTIKFDIDLPTADESLKQQVKSVINTEEMMNRQIAYLLVVNSFYNPAQVTTANQSALSSFVTSTLSAHLNNFIQKTIQSDMLSVGFDVQQTDVTDTQYKAQVMIQPDPKIILNGNVGYRNDNYTLNPEDRYMWDVDFEYMLTESGRLRFKAYSHTIDRSQLKEAKTTQGMGFVYKEDFQSISEMWSYYWKLFSEKIKIKNEFK